MNKQTIELDVSKSHSGVCIRVGQGDVGGTTIEALIRDGGADIDLSGCAVHLVARLPDGRSYYRGRCATSGASATIEVDESRLCSVSGYTDEAYFTVEKGGRIYSTGRFSLDIERSALDGQRPAQSWDDAVQELIDRGSDAAEAAEKAASDATAAKDAALTAANRAEGILAQLPLPDGNILRGEASGTLAHAEDAYAAPPLGLTVYGASVQDGTPSPDAPKPIASVTEAALKVCGKNLFGDVGTRTVNGVTFSQEEDGSVAVKGTPTKAYSNIGCDLGTGVLGRTVTVACTGNVGNGAADPGAVYPQLTIENATGANTNAGLYSNMEKLTKSIPSDAKRASVAISCGIDVTQERNAAIKVMVSIGDSAEPYEPYVSTSIHIGLQGHELRSLPNGTRDEVRIDGAGNITLVKRVGTKLLDGSGTWKHVSSVSFPFRINVDDAANIYDATSQLMCSSYAPVEYNPTSGAAGVTASYDSSKNEFCFRDTRYADIDAFRSALTTSPATVLYPLAAPQDIPLGKVVMPTLPAPVVNAWVESDVSTDCRVEYVRDVNIVIERLETQLAAVAAAAI